MKSDGTTTNIGFIFAQIGEILRRQTSCLYGMALPRRAEGGGEGGRSQIDLSLGLHSRRVVVMERFVRTKSEGSQVPDMNT